MLELRDVSAGYSLNNVIHGLTLSVRSGSITSLIGANGAGKTTMLRCITNVVRASAGAIEFDGQSILGSRPESILERGISMVPEGRRIFEGLTVLENLHVGAYTCSSRAEITRRLAVVLEYFPRLQERRNQMGSSLSGGEQQMLAIGRSLMSAPKVLLLDEPSMGLAPLIVDQVFLVIEKLRAAGTTILLVEQNARRALALADHAYVLEAGHVVMQGSGRELLGEKKVMATYLGEG